MQRRKGYKAFQHSEPEFLIHYMDRHQDWAVVVCLVGGGQEIHDGEAGIGAWIDAIRGKFAHWRVYISPRLRASEYGATELIELLPSNVRVSQEPDLHLAVSLRAFRSERVSEFVRTALECDKPEAQNLLRQVAPAYPIALTRDLDRAKAWLREHARGTERCGLVASSEAARLKPHAIDIRVKVNPVHYFLNGPGDTRSSYYLEDAATEFQIQGLELDWICVNWDADLRYSTDGWGHHQFRGKRWQRCRQPERQRYMLNAYRVLLTRARQGMVIFVPRGDPHDPTRDPSFYDGTYEYLLSLGIESIK